MKQPTSKRAAKPTSDSTFDLASMPHRADSVPLPDALRRNPLGMHPCALTPMPAELRPCAAVGALRGGAVGSRRAPGVVSGYVSPLRARAERTGHLDELRQRLTAARREVRAGGSLLEAVADGTLEGWRARLALQHALGFPLADWDNAAGRTQGERLALVERVLSELGVAQVRRGGWSVSGR